MELICNTSSLSFPDFCYSGCALQNVPFLKPQSLFVRIADAGEYGLSLLDKGPLIVLQFCYPG